MPPSYFELTADEQTELLQGAAYRTPWSIKMLEKDVYAYDVEIAGYHD